MSKSVLNITIDNIDLVIGLDLNGSNKMCHLCKQDLYAPCLSEKINELDSNVTKGECGHIFHSMCIQKYMTTNMSCPIDNTIWKKNKIINTDALILSDE